MFLMSFHQVLACTCPTHSNFIGKTPWFLYRSEFKTSKMKTYLHPQDIPCRSGCFSDWLLKDCDSSCSLHTVRWLINDLFHPGGRRPSTGILEFIFYVSKCDTHCSALWELQYRRIYQQHSQHCLVKYVLPSALNHR